MDEDIVRTGSRLVYENRWMRVREDAIRRRDGSSSIYGVVEKPDFVVIAPVWPDGRIQLVEQYRYPVRGRYWELPQGSWQDAPDKDPTELARAELREETGLDAERLVRVGPLFQCYGYSTQGYYIFLATGLRPADGPVHPDPEEQDLITRAFPMAEVEAMLRDGVIRDATTVAAFGLLRLKGLI